LSLGPNLPSHWMKPGKRYGASGLNFAADRLDIFLEVLDDTSMQVTGAWRGAVRVTSIETAAGRPVEPLAHGQTFRFKARNYGRYHLGLAL